MKVLLINGSSNQNGCTNRALQEVAKTLAEEGIESEIFQIGNKPIRDCIGCMQCAKTLKNNTCIFSDDIVNELIAKAKDCDGFVFGTPVYYAHPSGRILSLLDRVFYAGSRVFKHKPAFAVASARRAGTTASIDVLNKYFTIAQMPVASSSYWTMVHGNTAEQVEQDLEGLQTMRNGARNLAWLMKCIELGKKNGVDVPKNESGTRTNFIR
ncbi:MAG: flavodoxin family protein [Clostridia bacterium]|nr:flavodoxin family protein [Clostridia bacterium]MDE7328411.1 flavodoxin family protein [Clostridia bacterium]